MDCFDWHTHNLKAHDAIINVDPGFCAFEPGRLYSTGIHPWYTAEATEETWRALEATAANPRVVAIGECGLDRKRGGDMAAQLAAFKRQIALSEELGKPLTIHCVGCAGEMLSLRRKFAPTQPWIWHGFRKGPQLARQLTDAGIYLSLGQRFNPDVIREIPQSKLLMETDDSPESIAAVAAAFPPGLPEIMSANARLLLKPRQ